MILWPIIFVLFDCHAQKAMTQPPIQTRTNMKSLNDRRKHERKTCLLSVDWSVSNSIYTNSIRNVSEGGMFIETTEPFEIGQTISLRILAPSHLNKINQLHAKIRRIEPEGIAVEFLKDDSRQTEMIQFLMENI